MRAKILRPEQIVFNKVTGEEYVITSVTGAGDEKVAKAVSLSEQLNKPFPTEVTITKDNAIAFRFMKDPNPLDLAVAELTTDGKLIVNGTDVETGEITLLRILGTLRRVVILEGEYNGANFVYTYDVLDDKFRPIIDTTTYYITPAVVTADKNSDFLILCVLDENNGESSIVKITSRDTLFFNTSPYVVKPDSVKFADKEMRYVSFTADVFYNSKEDGEDGIVTYVMEPVKTADEKGGTATIVIDLGKCMDMLVYTDAYNNRADAYFSPVYGLTVIRNNKLEVINANILIPLTTEAEAAVREHQTLVDITITENVTRLSFADNKYDIITLEAAYTRDRGILVSLK